MGRYAVSCEAYWTGHLPIMSALLIAIKAGLVELEHLTGSQTFNLIRTGVDYTCTSSTLKRGTSMEIGGEVYDVKLSLFVRRDELAGEVIVSGDKLLFNSRRYRVIQVNDDNGELVLADPNV